MKRIANECFFAWVESEIKSGRSVKFRVKGNSMMPLLRNGKDEVVVGPYDKEELKLFVCHSVPADRPVCIASDYSKKRTVVI